MICRFDHFTRHFAILGTLLFLHFSYLYPQKYEYRVETIPLTGELSNFSGTDILQDSDGFMWFGSTRGLYRYDGVHYKHYQAQPFNPNSIADNWVRCMMEDKEGYLWIGITYGLVRFDRKTGRFRRFVNNFDTDNREENKWNSIKHIVEGEDGILWIGTDRGLIRFHKQSETFEKWSIDTLDEEGSGILDWYLYNSSSDTLWAIGGDNRLYAFLKDRGIFKRILNAPPSLTKVFQDSRGRFWVTSWNGLFLYNRSTGIFNRVLADPADPNYLPDQKVRNILEDMDGNLCIRTGDGIYLYEPDLTRIFEWKSAREYKWRSPDWELTKWICMDRNGSIWFLTEDGVQNLIRQPVNFKLYNPPLYSQAKISAFCREDKDVIWFSAFGGILYRLDRYNGTCNKYYLNPAFISEKLWEFVIEKIYIDSHGVLWVGTRDDGLFRLKQLQKGIVTFKNYAADPSDSTKLQNSGVYDIFEDSHKHLWISVKNHTPCFYDRGKDRMVHLVRNPSIDVPMKFNNLRIREEIDSTYLIAGKGEYIYKLFHPFITVSDNAVMPSDVLHVLPGLDGRAVRHGKVIQSHVNGNEVFWMMVQETGLYKCYLDAFADKNLENRFFSHQDGLVDNEVMCMVKDHRSNIWIGTWNGLSRFDPVTESFTNFTKQNGLPVSVFKKTGTSYEDGEVLMATDNGILSFYPDSIRLNKDLPPVFLTSLKINNETVPVSEETFLEKLISYTRSLELSYEQNNLSFEFAILNYVQSDLNQYRYKLEGLHRDWIFLGNRTDVDIVNLKPGRYTFRVQASNNTGLWNEEGASLDIIIHPPPWLAWYAYIVYVLFLAGIGIWIYRYLVNRARMRMAVEVERMEKEKALELDNMKSRFFANVSHEFRTPLTLLLGPVEELRKMLPDLSDESRGLLKTMKRNAFRLQTLVNQLLDISKLETGKVKLEVSEGDLTGFVRTIVLSFLSLAESKNITYEYDLAEHPQKLLFDKDKLEKILANLISNAFKFTPAGGKVAVGMKFLPGQDPDFPDRIEISVSDTGKGIPETEQDKIFDRFYQVSDSDAREQEGTGIGLALTRELVDLYRGEIGLRSKVNHGSTFTVNLPVLRETFSEEEIVEASTVGKEKSGFEEFVPVERGETGEKGSLVADTGKNGPFILIVEDNLDLRNYISRNLVSDYRILEAGNGSEGFEKAAEEIPDLVITDLIMPEMDGIEMCGRLKEDERTSHIPVIMLTAKADRTSKLKGLKTGADDYLIKPFDTEELQVRVRNLIEQRRKLREKFRQEFVTQPDLENIQSPDDQLLQKILDLLNRHLEEPDFHTDRMSGELNMSRMQMYRKINALTGYTPIELLRTIRLKKAASLFRLGHKNIAQVMYQVGFNSQSYFAKCFRNVYRVNPSEYIKAHIQ